MGLPRDQEGTWTALRGLQTELGGDQGEVGELLPELGGSQWELGGPQSELGGPSRKLRGSQGIKEGLGGKGIERDKNKLPPKIFPFFHFFIIGKCRGLNCT